MSYRHYDDTPSRGGGRRADPSIDAWFRELRGDAAPTEVRSSAAAARQRQRELEAEPEGWYRGGERRPVPRAEQWNVDTRTWAPDWDTNATSYLPRATGPSPRGGLKPVPNRDRRPTGEQPRAVDRRITGEQLRPIDRRMTGEQPRAVDRRGTAEQPRPIDRRPTGEQPRAVDRRITGEQPRPIDRRMTAEQPRAVDRRITGEQPRPIDRRMTGEQPRVTDRRGTAEQPRVTDRRGTAEQPQVSDWRPSEPRAIEPRPAENRGAEIRDLNEARELREAARSARAGQPRPANPRDSYDTTYDDISSGTHRAPSTPSRGRAHAAPAAQPAPSVPPAHAAPGSPAASAGQHAAPYSPSAAAAHAATASPSYASTTYGPSQSSRDVSARSYSPGPASDQLGYSAADYVAPASQHTQGALAAAPTYTEPREGDGYTGTRLPEPRKPDSQFDVVLPDSLGTPMLAFKNGQWFRLGAGGITNSPITLRSAVLEHADLAGSIVQIVCWWMRENSRRERALDIATELALAVTELTHMAELRGKTPVAAY